MKVIKPDTLRPTGVLPLDVVPGRVYQGNNNGTYYFAAYVGDEKHLVTFFDGCARGVCTFGGRFIEVDAEVVIK